MEPQYVPSLDEATDGILIMLGEHPHLERLTVGQATEYSHLAHLFCQYWEISIERVIRRIAAARRGEEFGG